MGRHVRGCGRQLGRGRIQQNEIIPDNRNGEDERVDTIEDAAVSGEERAGIFHACAALVGGFEQVANLACNISDCGGTEQ